MSTCPQEGQAPDYGGVSLSSQLVGTLLSHHGPLERDEQWKPRQRPSSEVLGRRNPPAASRQALAVAGGLWLPGSATSQSPTPPRTDLLQIFTVLREAAEKRLGSVCLPKGSCLPGDSEKTTSQSNGVEGWVLWLDSMLNLSASHPHCQPSRQLTRLERRVQEGPCGEGAVAAWRKGDLG